jgi:hypothetical protein
MERTHTLAVSLYGGLIALRSSVHRGQSLLMTNSVSRVSKECRIVYLGPKHRDQRQVGVEFMDPVSDFWNISFPAPVSKPFLEQIESSKESPCSASLRVPSTGAPDDWLLSMGLLIAPTDGASRQRHTTPGHRFRRVLRAVVGRSSRQNAESKPGPTA